MKSLMLGKDMVINVGRYHRLCSVRPANYVIFGYQPSKANTTAVSKTAYGFTFFAPAAHRQFAIKTGADGFSLSWDEVLAALERYSRSSLPMRTIGFPAHTFFLLEYMEKNDIRFQMPKSSLLTVGGGWKQFYSQKPDKERFYQLAHDRLDIDEQHIIEFFGAVEHPILYTDCRCHHFHIHVYSKVIIRDVDTLKPVKNGEAGIIDLITPMMHGCPLSSIVTDDLGILHDEPCACGAKSPWLEIIGRVGVSGIVTCAAGAEELLKGGTA
ncbi:MAG: acyl-protein synthetase [Oscillospiraceae bacterium]|nr:acyl-protein synthetase [Oscillospiraceae bacterium]